jgi:hypothetical protein
MPEPTSEPGSSTQHPILKRESEEKISVTHTPLPTRAGSHGANFLSGQMGQLPRCGRTVDRRLLPEPVFGVHLSISAARCVLPSPLPVPHLPLPHHSHAHNGVHCSCLPFCSSPARPVRGPAPCCWPKLPISMPDEPAPPRAVSSTPRAIGRARALACLVRVFRRGEFCSRSPDRIRVPPRPSQVWPTAPISCATISGTVCRRQWAAGGQRRCE